MALNFNDHCHPLLLEQVPLGARSALDVGCGTGRFARLLAGRGLDVEGVDANEDVISAAPAARGGPRYQQMDIREQQLPCARYHFISCIASLHHMPFDTVLHLRKALAPGGVLAVLGLYPVRTATDFLSALPALSLLRADWLLGKRHPTPPHPTYTGPDGLAAPADVRRNPRRIRPAAARLNPAPSAVLEVPAGVPHLTCIC